MTESLPAPREDAQHAPGQVAETPPQAGAFTVGLTTEPRPHMVPLAGERFTLPLTITRDLHDKLRHAQALLRRQIPSGDLVQVLERLVDLGIGQLEKQRFAATDRPRRDAGRPSRHPRHITAPIRRAARQCIARA